MTEQETDLEDPRGLHGAAEHLTDRWAGVFFPQLVNRCVARVHVALAAGARIQNRLAPIAVHAARNRLAALARAKGSRRAPVRQVLFVDAHDTGPTQIAAGLLAHHAGTAVVASPGAMVQAWPTGPSLDGDQHQAVVADLDHRVQALWVEISTSAATTPPRPGPRI